MGRAWGALATDPLSRLLRESLVHTCHYQCSVLTASAPACTGVSWGMAGSLISMLGGRAGWSGSHPLTGLASPFSSHPGGKQPGSPGAAGTPSPADERLSSSWESRPGVRGVAMFAEAPLARVSCSGQPWPCLTSYKSANIVSGETAASMDVGLVGAAMERPTKEGL